MRALSLGQDVEQNRPKKLRSNGIFAGTGLLETVHNEQQDSARAYSDRRAISAAPATRRILLVSEDAGLRSLLRSFLEHAGFKVIGCGDSGRAVEMVRLRADVDLAIVDMRNCAENMALADQLAYFRPDLQVVMLCSGSVGDWVVRRCGDRGWQILHKPFPLPVVLGAVQAAVDRMTWGTLRKGERKGSKTWGNEGAAMGFPVQSASKPDFESNPRRRILCVSDYEPLRITRAHLLRRNGFDVQAVDSQAFEELVELRCFSLVIVCQSIPAERAAEIAGKTKRLSPGTLLLRVQLMPMREEALIFDAVMEGTSMPQQFVTSVMRMFEGPQAFRSA